MNDIGLHCVHVGYKLGNELHCHHTPRVTSQVTSIVGYAVVITDVIIMILQTFFVTLQVFAE